MTENQRKEQFSRAYLHAVASQAGCSCTQPSVDDRSVDVIIDGCRVVRRRPLLRFPKIDVQLKATSQDILRDACLAFRLPMKNYRELRLKTQVPRILVVLLVPDDPAEWLDQNEERMIIKHCAYWTSLLGEPRRDGKSVTVYLERENRFTADSLCEMFLRANDGRPL